MMNSIFTALSSLRTVLLWAALLSPALGQTQQYSGQALLPVIKDVANQLQLYLDYVAKSGGRPDFTTPPVSDQFSRLFDPGQLAALPPPKASDVPWLMDWTVTANGIAKAILYFGITSPADPTGDAAAIKRNMTDYEDQQAAAMSFMHSPPGARHAGLVFIHGATRGRATHAGTNGGLQQSARR